MFNNRLHFVYIVVCLKGFDSGPTVYQKTGGGFADDNFGTEECWD